MLRERTTRIRVLAALLGVAAAGGVAFAVTARHGGAKASASPTATATRGDILNTVGGVGRIVEARTSSQIAVPAAAGGSATAGSATAAPATASRDAVFPSAVGHLARFLVAPGRHVAAGQALAILDDGGAAAVAVAQAQSDLSVARVELAQRRTQDPSKGVPAAPAELAAARGAVTAAQARLALLRHPGAADLAAARLDVRKAEADAATLSRGPVPEALDAARLAVDAARERIGRAGGATQTDLLAAQLELKKAQADLEALRTAPPAASATAIQAGQLAVDLARQRLAELPSSAPRSDVLSAQHELKKAERDLEALRRTPPGPSASALAAAQLAVDLASQRLGQLTATPTAPALSTAQLDLAKAAAELAALQRTPLPASTDAARFAVAAAKRKLQQLLHPLAAGRLAARADLAKALGDLAALRRRGGPATPLEIELAGLKARAAAAKLSATEAQAARLTVRAPAAGTVTALLTVPGAPADPSTPVATVADLAHLAVNVELSEFDAAHVHRGERAVVSVDALGGRKLSGTVRFEALVGVENGGVVSFPVRVSLNGRARGVKPGMNVSVRIVVAERRNIVRVPLEAISHEGGGATVTVLDAARRTSRRQVTLGLADNKNVEVAAGLRPGERVLLASAGGV